MRIVRFVPASSPHGHDPYQPGARYGRLDGDRVLPFSYDFDALVQAAQDLDALAQAASEADAVALADVIVLPPSAPSKIICVGLNYKHHAEEVGKPLPPEPLIFLKPPSSLLAPGQPIALPPSSQLVHHEGELAVVIGRGGRDIAKADALDHVLGITCMNDVTARDIQRREKRYTRGKGFDTFAPCGPALLLGADPQALTVTTRVNGTQRQHSPTHDMIFSVAEAVAFVASIMTLRPGDIITTGTPSGVGPLVDGDTVEVEVSGVGVLTNPVVGRA